MTRSDFRPESKMQLSEALAYFCPTYEDLEELKHTLIENMQYAIEQIKKDHPAGMNQDEFDAWFREEFGIGRKRLPDDQFVIFMEIRGEIQALMIEQATEYPRRVLKRIVSVQQHLLQPKKKQGGVTDAEIERAREHPLEQLMEQRVFKQGGRLVTHCPFHKERTPSFYIFPDNHFKCFGCQEHGDAIAFVMKRDGLKFIEAVKKLINYAN